MKRNYTNPSLLMLLCIILGMIPPTVYHLLVTRPQPTPSSLWDSRPCRAAPGPLTCNGILPHALRDLQAITRSSIPGDGMCIDQHSQQWSMSIFDTGKGHNNQPLGTLTLWWLPLCQSAFAAMTYTGENDAFISAQLIIHSRGNTWTQQDQRETEIIAGGTEHAIWTALQWSAGTPVSACGDMWVPYGSSYRTYATCTATYQDGRPTGG